MLRRATASISGYSIYDRHEPGADQIYDVALGVGVNLVRRLARTEGGAARGTHLPSWQRAAPSNTSRSTAARVRLNQPYAALVLSADAMRLPIRGGDPALRRKLGEAVEAALLTGALDFASHVRHILTPSILLGGATSERIARRSACAVRTMNRRLKDEGTSFRAIKQEVRFTIACELLSLTDLGIADISGARLWHERLRPCLPPLVRHFADGVAPGAAQERSGLSCGRRSGLFRRRRRRRDMAGRVHGELGLELGDAGRPAPVLGARLLRHLPHDLELVAA